MEKFIVTHKQTREEWIVTDAYTIKDMRWYLLVNPKGMRRITHDMLVKKYNMQR